MEEVEINGHYRDVPKGYLMMEERYLKEIEGKRFKANMYAERLRRISIYMQIRFYRYNGIREVI